MTFKEIKQLDPFKKDLKALLKRFHTLKEDLSSFERTQLIAFHKHNIDNGGIERMNGFHIEEPRIYKVTKFACKSIKKGVHSGIRMTYAYFSLEDRIELIEMYFKGDSENEDRERIKRIYSR